jgi:hypothetical protein
MHGDKRTFCVEAETFPAAVGGYSFVRGCLWIRGDRVGNTEEVSEYHLYKSALHDMLQRLGTQEQETSDQIMDADSEQLVHCFQRKLWSGIEGSASFAVADPIRYFALPIGVEIFDGDQAYLIKGTRSDKVIWQPWGEDVPKSDLLPKGLYEEMIRNCLRDL